MDNNQNMNQDNTVDQNNQMIPNGTVNIDGQEFKAYFPEQGQQAQNVPPQNIPSQNVPPQNQVNKKYISPEDKKHANILCIISVLCFFAVPSVLAALMELIHNINYDIYDVFDHIASSVSVASFIVAITLMILVRVKYPNSVFGKVLMWLYIAVIVLAVIGFFFLLAFIYILCSGCRGMG